MAHGAQRLGHVQAVGRRQVIAQHQDVRIPIRCNVEHFVAVVNARYRVAPGANCRAEVPGHRAVGMGDEEARPSRLRVRCLSRFRTKGDLLRSEGLGQVAVRPGFPPARMSQS